LRAWRIDIGVRVKDIRVGIRAWPASIALAMLVLPLSAAAALGGNAASVRADQVQLAATLRTSTVGQYSQYELEMPSGTLIREYVSSAGVVFAVAWEGPSLPDLRQVLGKYFAQYVDAAQGTGAGSRLIHLPGLVVYSGGRMRAFFGKAYVPQLLPAGVLPDDIH
jgi:hypothetical protein